MSACIEKNCIIEHEIEFKLKECSSPQCNYTLTEKYSINESDSIQSDKTNPITRNYVCAHSSDDPSNSKNLNGLIIDELSKLAAVYKNSNDQWRWFAYEKAIAAIKKYPKTIHSRKGKTDMLLKNAEKTLLYLHLRTILKHSNKYHSKRQQV